MAALEKKRGSRQITTSGNLDAMQFRSLVRYSELLKIFASREITARFKGSTLGIVWLIMQPIAYVFIISLFFSYVGRNVDGNVPYPIYLFLGILPFMLFNRSLSGGASFLRAKSSLLRQIYVPAIVVVSASFVNILLEFAIFVLIMTCAFFYFGVSVSSKAVFLIPLYMFFLMFCFSVASGFSVIGVLVPDFRHFLPTLSQFLFFGTPIFYSLDNLPETLVWLISVNPLIMFSEMGRYLLFDHMSSHGFAPILISFGSAVLLACICLYIFRRIAVVIGAIL